MKEYEKDCRDYLSRISDKGQDISKEMVIRDCHDNCICSRCNTPYNRTGNCVSIQCVKCKIYIHYAGAAVYYSDSKFKNISPTKGGLNFSGIEIEIAESIKSMGIKEAEDRLNFLKNADDGLTDLEYVKLWHLVHSDNPTVHNENKSTSILSKFFKWLET